MEVLVYLGLFIFSVFMEGFFSGSEIAFVSLDPHLFVKFKSDRRYKDVLFFKENPSRLLNVTLIGTNLSAVFASTLSSMVLVSLFGFSSSIAALFVVPFMLFFGEILPKIMYQSNAERLALFVVPFIKFFYKLFFPLSFIMFVLDTSAFLHGDPSVLRGYTTPRVVDELKSVEAHSRLWLLEESVNVERPLPYFVRQVRRFLRRIGETRLSETDISVLALSLQKRLPLLTDDYALQNAALLLGVGVSGLLFGRVEKVLRYRWICTACGRVYPPGVRRCPVCGGKVKPTPFPDQ